MSGEKTVRDWLHLAEKELKRSPDTLVWHTPEVSRSSRSIRQTTCNMFPS